MKSRWSLLLCLLLLWSVGCGLPPLPVQPAPQPIPVVKVDSLLLLSIDDWAQRSASKATRDLLGDGDYHAALTARGHVWLVGDAMEYGEKYKASISAAGGLPVLIVWDKATGKQITATKLPADKAGMEKLIGTWSTK